MPATYRKKKIEDLIQEIMNLKLISLVQMDKLQESLLEYDVNLFILHKGKVAGYDIIIKRIRGEFNLNEGT